MNMKTKAPRRKPTHPNRQQQADCGFTLPDCERWAEDQQREMTRLTWIPLQGRSLSICHPNAVAMRWRPSIRTATISNISTNQSKAIGEHFIMSGRRVESLIMLDVAFKGQGTAVGKKKKKKKSPYNGY